MSCTILFSQGIVIIETNSMDITMQPTLIVTLLNSQSSMAVLGYYALRHKGATIRRRSHLLHGFISDGTDWSVILRYSFLRLART